MFMKKRTVIYTKLDPSQTGTEPEFLHDLRQAVEHRGDVVVAAFVDDGRIAGRGKYAGWRSLVARLDVVDQVVVGCAGDLPGWKAIDLLKLLGLLRAHGVSLYVRPDGIDTDAGSEAILDLIVAYRRAKFSEAVRAGQKRAAAKGRRPGRPTIPNTVLIRIQASLKSGLGIRPTARRHNVSPASVVNISRSLSANSEKLAA
jgi:DNA invertase Pin-like site-specific DNA recombinase